MPFALFIDFSKVLAGFSMVFIDLPKVFIDLSIVFIEISMVSIDCSMGSIDFSMHNMHLVNISEYRLKHVLGQNSGIGCYHSVGWLRVYLGLV